MSFISVQFLAFMAVVLLLYYLLPKKIQWIFLLIASYSFYLFGGISPLIFIASTTLTVYGGARWMDHVKKTHAEKAAAKKINKRILLALVLFNFGILLMLKYYNFFADNMSSLFTMFKYDLSMPLVNIVLPLGISFYTFQAVGYCIDVYRNKYSAETNLARFALFISFFPQIIEGPISRYDNLGAKLKQEHRFNYRQFKFGAQLMLWGFFKKMVIADRAGVLVSQVFGDYTNYDGLQTFVAIVIYAIQIYADFSGGIDIARGAAQMMDIDLIPNFQRPYFGTSVAEYWRRWHMSLTGWMRDYVFFPLTLSKMSARTGRWARGHLKGTIGKQLPTYLPTFITFFLIGIWHGASWGFIVFGLYNASIIVISMLLTPAFQKINTFLHINAKSFGWKVWQIIRTFAIMAAGKCIVKAASVSAAFAMLSKCTTMFNFSDLRYRLTSMGLDGNNLYVLFFSVLIFFIVSVLQENGFKVREMIEKRPLPARWILYLLTLAAILIFGVYGAGYSVDEFVYRNF